MSRRTIYRIAAAVVTIFVSTGLSAQEYGSYSPYSIYGVGDIATPGSAYNKTMGGTGIAGRSNRYINLLNPAAVTARDSLAFMTDFSIYQNNSIFRQGDMLAASNIANIGDLVMSFPIWRSSAMMIGITPYSSTGYNYGRTYVDPELIGHTGNIAYTASGKGTLYDAFAAAGVTFWKRLSLGAQFTYTFGKTEKKYNETFTDASFNGATNGYNMQLKGMSWKFGLQYEQPVGKRASLVVGATYRTQTQLDGFVEGYRLSTGTAASDTLYYSYGPPSGVSLASELGVGICFKYADKFSAEFDYTQSDWSSSGMDETAGFMGDNIPGSGRSHFSSTVDRSFRLGAEYTPNRNDIRYYYKKIAYRAGAYYKNEYYKLDGNDINSYGITIGITLPVFRWYNGLTLGVDIGSRGSLQNNLIRQTYFNFSAGVNLFDIWFQKPRYE